MTPIPYEFHVTVRTSDVDLFKRVCQKIGVKAIVLDLQNNNGQTVMNDVMTSSHTALTNDNSAIAEVNRIASELTKSGLTVLRKKIEAAPWHPLVPLDASQQMPTGAYFEAHIGVVTEESRVVDLREATTCTDAHVSRNVLKKRGDGLVKIMLTIRRHTGTLSEFSGLVEDVCRLLDTNKFQYEKVITEFAVFDTKLDHDALWLS